LQFDVSAESSNASADIGPRIWFTEQSENKIGFIDLDKGIPISLSISPKVISLRNSNNSIENIEITVNKSDPILDFQKHIPPLTHNDTFFFKPIIAGTFVPNGDLMGMRVSFYPEILEIKSQDLIENETTYLGRVNVTLGGTQYVPPGNYSLMIGLEGQDFSILKKVKLNISD
jgi:virginiamycin B lyase